jgi:D-arabinose 1-dehydrogenase-like Zn-dependent alcohol dehydrogenase
MNPPARAQTIVLERFGEPVRVQEVPVPEPAAGALLARVELAGVCGTDVHLQAGRLPIPLPVVLGHEGVGRVAALGDGTTEDSLGAPLAVGDAIAWGSSISCRDCFYCRDAGEPTLCERRKIYGINRRADEWPHLGGAWADMIYLHPGTMVARLDDGTPPEAVIALGARARRRSTACWGSLPRGR